MPPKPGPPASPILAVQAWLSNAEMIADVAMLHYLDGHVCDVTWGRGTFWKVWQPERLTKHDLYTVDGIDFRHLPEEDQTYDSVVIDPDYKLNGTPALGDFDNRYGIDKPMRWQDRMQKIRDGLSEACRVSKKFVLLKCQDQVCSGKIRWQTLEFPAHAASLGFELEDRFDLLNGGRPQPLGRTQRHAYGRPSTLLVFKRR